MDQITLRGMRFHTLVGILSHERSIAQPLEIDVTVSVSVSGGGGDGIVDYRQLYDSVAAVMSSGPIDYLEEIGERIARAALGQSPRARHVRVAVRKPHVALGGPLDYAEVVVERDAREANA
jgi:7,8-dihydroneopterin aldolase/epimerase/oxygenase